MKKISFALISDSVFVALCTFLLGFTLTRFYVKSAVFALIIAVICAISAGVFAFLLLLNKRKRRIMLDLNAKEKQTLALHLSVCSENYLFDLFERALDGTYAVSNRLESENEAYFLHFTLSPLSPDDVAKCIKFGTAKRKNILCCTAGAESENLAAEFGIELKNIGEIYALLKDKNLLPEKYACGEIRKQKAWSKLKKRFNRRLCPSLFFCGLSLLFFSFFTYFKIYYIVCGGLLLILSAISLLFGEASR